MRLKHRLYRVLNPMDAQTYEDAAAHLDALMDQAVDDAETIIITRSGKPPGGADVARRMERVARLQESFRQVDGGSRG
jgi:hypothetical protein